MGRGGAADHDVDLREFERPVLEMHRAAAQFGCQREGAVVRTVRNDDAPRAPREQRAGGFLAGVARADDHHLALLE